VTGETPTLEELAADLESVADKLRAEAIDAEEAADLVERCADLAQRIGAEIDARSRTAGEVEGQERLL
jgi:methyl-accepting chemotaxis protein